MNELDAIIRDEFAEANAERDYSRRAGELFELEDLHRSIGDNQRAGDYHWAAIIAGHAAWAEAKDPEPR